VICFREKEAEVTSFDEPDREDDEPAEEDPLDIEEPEGGEPWAKTSSGDADEI
jgi:hypothetical protein